MIEPETGTDDGTARTPPQTPGHPVLVLIGMRGSGKTTIGRAVAARLGLPFVDSDAEIEARAGQPIPEIFATHGQPHFRELEAAALRDLLARPGIVLATGGGCILHPETRARLAALPCVVWLRAPAAVLAARIAADATTDRPSLTGAAPATELAAVLAEREPLYAAAATRVLDVADLRLAAAVDLLLHL